MYSSQNLLNLGQMLKEKREDQGLSLKKISERTKINVLTLQAIESAQVDHLPIYTYLRGFIIAYAKALGISEKEIEKTLAILAPSGENPSLSGLPGTFSPAERLVEKDLRLTPVILAISILFILGSILVFTNMIKSYKKESMSGTLVDPDQELLTPKEDKKPDMNASDTEEEKEALDNSDAEQKREEKIEKSQPSVLARPSPSPPPSSVELIVKAIGEVTVSYQVDGQSTKKVSLKEDQFEVLKGKESIFIQTKDSDLIYIFYNGKNLGLFGTGGKKEKLFSPDENMI
ncbi:MAG: helix-turn-helix domain-containing protein [Bdellovibrionales bacterium]|nr:helix-turn-helix domain-containing protein [Bdellovibrionales bacterium]